ncbi:hypothetical protein P5V15_004385 [Pogonomyrmex californicus]
MPVFHTKTIESILEPVAQQVSRLVILHEEAEDGNAMPDLGRPVQAVSMAVTNLVKVGKETINSSDDALLKQDMPAALQRVEGASRLLEEASAMLKEDPYSGPARKKLIEGSRGILQGTSSLLLCFDESEVRKIIRECKRVLDYLAVTEVIETMEDLVHFLKNLSPCLSKVSREVGAREKELTHQVHREILIRCLDQIKILAPILICSMKIFIHIISQGGKGAEEAAENRNYLSGRMSDELNEIIRVLQLTTYDEEEWDADQLTVLKKAQSAIESRIRAAFDWLDDGKALRGGVGEKSLRQIIEQALRLAECYLPPSQAEPISKLASQIITMTDALCELRQNEKGTAPQAEALARSIKEKLNELRSLVASALVAADKSGIAQTAHTVAGRLEQANKWLLNPQHDDKGLGKRAIALIIHEGKKNEQPIANVRRSAQNFSIIPIKTSSNSSYKLFYVLSHSYSLIPSTNPQFSHTSLYNVSNNLNISAFDRLLKSIILQPRQQIGSKNRADAEPIPNFTLPGSSMPLRGHLPSSFFFWGSFRGSFCPYGHPRLGICPKSLGKTMVQKNQERGGLLKKRICLAGYPDPMFYILFACRPKETLPNLFKSLFTSKYINQTWREIWSVLIKNFLLYYRTISRYNIFRKDILKLLEKFRKTFLL